MERFLFKRIELWVLLVTVLVAVLGLIAFGGILMDELRGKKRFGMVGAGAVAVAEMPGEIEAVFKDDDPMEVFQKHKSDGQAGWSWTRGTPGAGLPGYWIMSHFDFGRQRSLIDMVRLSDGQIVYTWTPDADQLLQGAKRTSQIAIFPNWRTAKFKFYHPWLMPDGDLIVKDDHTPLLRFDGCGRKIWMQDGALFHHSTESDGADGLWIPSVIEPATVSDVPPTFQEDALTHVAFDGRILAQISVPQMLLRHDLPNLLFPPGEYNDDPLHLNDIQPVPGDGPYWKKGDLFVSLRRSSTVLLYRPATDEIVWMKSGPWLGQHDVDILDDHRIAIYNNRAENRGGKIIGGSSEIMVYDFATGAVSRPYSDVMAREQVFSYYEGLYTILPGGAFVIEDHNSGRVLVFAADGQKLGQFVNRNANGKIYEIGWGRYVGPEEGDAALTALARLDCASPPAP